jgi:hypothetical protein
LRKTIAAQSAQIAAQSEQLTDMSARLKAAGLRARLRSFVTRKPV